MDLVLIPCPFVSSSRYRGRGHLWIHHFLTARQLNSAERHENGQPENDSVTH